MGSIKNVVSEPIEGHEDYHMMVSAEQGARGAEARAGHPRVLVHAERGRGASPGLSSLPSRSLRAVRPPPPSPL